MLKLSHYRARICGLLRPPEKNGTRSFSQCGEDIIVRFLFRALGIDQPSYLDIGAHHPFYLSNTALFYLNGSRGICIEPDPDLFSLIRKARPRDINLNIGIGAEEGCRPFYRLSSPTLNTFSYAEAINSEKEGYKIKEKLNLPVKSIENVLGDHFEGHFPQFLSLDTEGLDLEILRTVDYGNPPIVICVETISFSSHRQGVKNHELIEYMHSRGYVTYADTYVNTIFVLERAWSA